MPIINGRPGTFWRNATPRVWYQWNATGAGTCPFCWSMDGRISTYFSIPAHRGCRCWQSQIFPGDIAPFPFVDPRKKIESLPPGERSKILGSAVWLLLKAGIITLDDIVDEAEHSTRSLAEIVAAKHLSVRRMTALGISLWIAKRAKEESEESPAEAAAARRDEKARRLTAPDDESEQLIKSLTPAQIVGGATLTAGLSLLGSPHGKTQADQLTAALSR